MQTTREKVSYCIGLETGKNLKQQFADMDFPALNQGLHDALKDAQPQLAKEEIQNILTSLKQQVEAQQKHYFIEIAAENKKQGEHFLAENKMQEGVITLPSGLQYKILTEGPGLSLYPTPFDVVKIHYRGSFINGRVFDSSYQRGQPSSFPLNRVITGWSEAIQKMRVGDKWQLFIPPYLAYAEQGYGPQIGPNTTLIFEIELLGINDASP